MKLFDQFTYKGVQYLPEKDYEDDNIKIFHIVKVQMLQWDTETSHRLDMRTVFKEESMDWSPYSTPSIEDFKLWVDLGRPNRIGIGPLNRKDLETIIDSQNETFVKK